MREVPNDRDWNKPTASATATSSPAMIVLTFFILLVHLSPRATGVPDFTLLHFSCQDTGDPLSRYQVAVRRVRRLMSERTAISGYSYRTYVNEGDAHCFGRSW
ncbi:hypothetical protein MLD38_026431 [Melastoma candidum]|uniref:Uncharacterized protein n=1 Tax=Melastoma candidum TaxID=119954 RepID=A0ACB9NZH0_9MYRT|nr:hypothetical protein MLD38_026431 [Melastoma candidum]